MNKLYKDILRHYLSILAIAGIFGGLAILKLIQVLLDLDEQEFYKRYPIGWWIVVILGLSFIAALIYSVIKKITIDPRIQLRDKSDETIQSILNDPDYELWHPEAQRQLDERHSTHSVKKNWYKKYAIVLIAVLFVFIDFGHRAMNGNLRTKNGGIIQLAGFYFYLVIGLLVFMTSGDRIRLVNLNRFKIPLSILRYMLFLVWLLGSLIWLIHIFGF
jgi:hypothetical protein